MTAKRTARDIVAAVKLGAIDPDAPILTADEAADLAAGAASLAAAADAAARADIIGDGTEHRCGIPGCRHGATATGHVPQPDRQTKVECPTCGAVARMTNAAIHRAGGLPTCHDGTPMVIGARRRYVRRSA